MHLSNQLPSNGLIPRDVTRVAELTEQTKADGHDVTIAVLDTGVDPGAAGLQTTSSGHRKIVDLVDCTSSGDVVMTERATLSSESTIVGLSGRVLHLPPELTALNVTNVFRIGLKHAYDFFPALLVRRLRRERRDVWDRAHRPILANARLNVDRLKADNASASAIDEAEARLAALLAAEKHYRDTGPVFDCIVFHDGDLWRAVVDTSQRGHLADCDVLEDFAIRGSYSCFPDGVFLNFAVNVYDDGDLLSIVVDCGSHGTHVAGIVGAHFPENPSLNGLAPGARIVSLKIGDSRLSSMETHQGLMRAVAYCLARSPYQRRVADDDSSADIDAFFASVSNSSVTDNVSSVSNVNVKRSDKPVDGEQASRRGPVDGGLGPTSQGGGAAGLRLRSATSRPRITIDMINMSFGEHSRDVDRGRFVGLVNKLVRKHNVIFVSSAGNEGPGLSSVSAPGGTTSSMIGVGAYVTSDMLTQAYSYLQSEYGRSNALTPSSSSTISTGFTRAVQTTGTKDDVGLAKMGKPNDSEPVVGMPYTWTSRGPVPNGSLGVCVCAPGGAIAPIPLWNLRKKQLMNGTSMSSPSAAGAIAVMLSFLKMKGIAYTSALIRRAIENTARPFKPLHVAARIGGVSSASAPVKGSDDTDIPRDLVFATGHGSIDAYAASKYIESYMALRTKPGFGLQNDQTVADSKTGKEGVVATSGEAVSTRSENGPLLKVGERPMGSRGECGDSSRFLEDWHIQISVEDGSLAPRKTIGSAGLGSVNSSRGIYLRSLADTSSVRRALVSVELEGYERECIATKKVLSEMEIRISLECSASWVEVPDSLVFMGGGRPFLVVVDPTRLAPGRVHFAEVLAYVCDSGDGAKRSGPVFRVPITIIKPEPLVHGVMIEPIHDVSFAPGTVLRRFYEAPQGATYALLKVTAGEVFVADRDTGTASDARCDGDVTVVAANGDKPVTSESTLVSAVQDLESMDVSGIDDDVDAIEAAEIKSGGGRMFDIHVVQLVPQKHCGETEWRQSLALFPGAVREGIMGVEGGCTLELCLAQSWSSAGPSCLSKVELVFGGVVPKPVVVHGAPGAMCFPRVEVASMFPSNVMRGNGAAQSITGYSPRGFLTHVNRVVVPKVSNIRALNERDDIVDEGKTFQMVIEYAFEVYESSSAVKLLFPGINRAVYESEIEGGPYVIVHDQDKQFLYSSDIYPHDRVMMKGEYVASAYIRHDSIEVLESLRQMRMTVEYALGSDISLDAYDTGHAACFGVDKRKCSRATANLDSAERRAFYFAVPKRSAFPKWANVGDVLEGYMTVDKLISGVGSGSRRGSDLPVYKVSLSVGPSASSSSSTKSGGKASEEQVSASDSNTNSGDVVLKEGEKDAEKSSDKAGGEGTAKDVERVKSGNDQWMDDALRKARLKRLRCAMTDKKIGPFEKLYRNTQQLYRDDVEVMLIKMEWVDTESCRLFDAEGSFTKLREMALDVVKVADAITKKLSPSAIAGHFGCNVDGDDPAAVATRKSFEKKRQILIETLFRKARVISLFVLYLEAGYGSGHVVSKGQQEGKQEGGGEECATAEEVDMFEKAMKELVKWTSLDGKGSLPGGSSQGLSYGSTTSEDLVLLSARREARRGRYGAALRVLDNFYGPGASKRLEAEAILRFKEHMFKVAGWNHLVHRHQCYRLMRFPRHHMPF